MNQKQISQWRTVGCAMLGAMMLLGAFTFLCWLAIRGYAAQTPLGVTDKMVDLYSKLVDGVKVLIIAVAAKAGWEHTTRNGGIAGVLKGIISASPTPPPAPPAPPETK